MRRWPVALLVLVLAGGLWLGATSSGLRSWLDSLTAPTLPVAENAAVTPTNTTVTNTATTNLNSVASVPAEKNLNVPFTSQAPSANWDADHEEFCEEAAILMVGRFYQGKGFATTADAENGLQTIKSWEVQNLGWYFDTTAAENAQILKGVFGLQTQLINNPTIQQLKAALAAGHPVIVPTAGRELGNPNFSGAGPIYHNLVLRGYTKDGKFITNDPGTRKGQAYVYDESVIMSAMHDWVPAGDRTVAANGSVDSGAAVAIVVTQN